LFASETVGAVQGIDPLSGHYFDDTRRYIEASLAANESMRRKIYEENALGVYPRLRVHPRFCGE
jgi:4-oxalmesaconate hydratase